MDLCVPAAAHQDHLDQQKPTNSPQDSTTSCPAGMLDMVAVCRDTIEKFHPLFEDAVAIAESTAL